VTTGDAPVQVPERLAAALADRYHIERELGGGGMSRVFVATETALGRRVVIKVVAPNLVEGMSAERFTREVRLAARLQQANIVPLLSAGEADGLAYYTMPFVDGLSLRARLASGESLGSGEAVHVLRDVAKALAYAHAQGVVHRDIKPENVLLSGGTAMVTDFGIAKALTASRAAAGEGEPAANVSGTLTSVGSSLGTPAYMAPEQAVGSAVDLRADLYAWGVMAYEMLAGAHPFAGKATAQALIAAHIAEAPPPLAGRAPSVPASIAAVVMRCLEKDPERRPSSAAEILSALDQASTPEGPSAMPPTGALARGSRRSRTREWVFLGLAMLLVIAAVAFVATRRRAERSPGAAAPASTAQSLAVIPFASTGGDSANAYFGEGIAEAVTTTLSRVAGLRLAGRNSAVRFQGKGASAQEVGEALDVTTVLDGTVRRSGDRVRVTAELTSAADGRVLWQDSFDRQVEDVFAVQDEIASAIALALQVRLGAGAGGARGSAERGTTDFAAYDAYLRGMELLRKRGPGMRRAEELFDEAIARDSTFARAWAGKARNLLIGSYFFDRRMSASLPPAREAARQALRLDPMLAEAHMAMGLVHAESFQWSEAEVETRRAIALDPSLAEAHFRLGFQMLSQGRVHESVPAFERARELDPLWSTPAVYVGYVWVLTGRVADGLAESERAIANDPTLESVQTVRTLTLIAAGRMNEAGALAARVAPTTRDLKRLGVYAYAMSRGGREAEGRALYERLRSLPPDSWGVQTGLATAALGVGDRDAALTHMERATTGDGDLFPSTPIVSPSFDEVRADPRFAAVLRRYDMDVERLTRPDGGRSR
jgi:TolB-like protein/tRNA A-37 threonylcarbamoyl transferase component Bud32/Tfp pilus assembly protein PilF